MTPTSFREKKRFLLVVQNERSQKLQYLFICQAETNYLIEKGLLVLKQSSYQSNI